MWNANLVSMLFHFRSNLNTKGVLVINILIHKEHLIKQRMGTGQDKIYACAYVYKYVEQRKSIHTEGTIYFFLHILSPASI